MGPPRSFQIMVAATVAMVGLVCPSNHAAARGGLSHPDVASTRYIEELPPEIQKALRRWQSACGSPLAARHPFAHYLGDTTSRYRLISLHFHELSCDNRAALCTNQGCLHQVYVSQDGAYRLAFSANVPEVTLRFLGNTPTVEIDCGPLDRQCPRVLRWNGRSFTER